MDGRDVGAARRGRTHPRDPTGGWRRRRGCLGLTIDPALANERAIRAYRGVGFRPVGVMRAYERGPDGTWHDGLLMDMLAGELS